MLGKQPAGHIDELDVGVFRSVRENTVPPGPGMFSAVAPTMATAGCWGEDGASIDYVLLKDAGLNGVQIQRTEVLGNWR